jgi:hypothetical protein
MEAGWQEVVINSVKIRTIWNAYFMYESIMALSENRMIDLYWMKTKDPEDFSIPSESFFKTDS